MITGFDTALEAARKFAEKAVDSYSPRWSRDDKENIAYFYGGVNGWSDIPEGHKNLLHKTYREAEFIRNWSGEVFVQKLKVLNLTDEQIIDILKAIDTTCSDCWDSDISGYKYCYCMADD